MASSEKILTKHPEGKNGTNISRAKYNQIKDYLLDVLSKHESITYQELNNMAVHDLKDSFQGKIPWYVVTVKLDLEARGIIERIPKTSPHKIRLKN